MGRGMERGRERGREGAMDGGREGGREVGREGALCQTYSLHMEGGRCRKDIGRDSGYPCREWQGGEGVGSREGV